MPPAAASSLPVQLSTFVGRERECNEVISRLETARLLTLVGAGGIGKTRLALHVAQSMAASFDDGVRLVELAGLSDPALLTDAVASALGLQDVRDQPVDQTLLSFLSDKRVLLVLDNCEHLLPAVSQLVGKILRAPGSGGVRVLATSRRALGVEGEIAWRVPSLRVADWRQAGGTDEICASEAVRLFCQRAQSTLPHFVFSDLNARDVAEVCERLDGIPLAIELAAARVRLLSPRQILARLDDRLRLLVGGSRTAPTRHQTLRATLDWSFVLLSGSEQALLRRLAVFAGGWTLEAAEAVGIANDIAASDVLALLDDLVDQSLIAVELDAHETQAQYRLLDTVRHYALEQLRAAGEEAAARERHMRWYMAAVEAAGPGLSGPRQAEELRWLEAEHDNLRAALACARDGDPETGLRIAAGLGRFWALRGHFVEGIGWLESLLASSPGARSDIRAAALLELGRLAVRAGNTAHACTALQQSLALAEAAADLGAVARAERALRLLRPGGDPEAIGYVLNNLGQLARARGDFVAARQQLEESLALFRAVGATSRVGWTLGCLSSVALMQNNLEAADRLLDEARVLLEGIGDKHVLRHGLWIAGVMAIRGRQYARGVRLIAAGARYPLVRVSLDPDELRDWDSSLALARSRLGAAAFAAAEAEGQAMSLEAAIAYGLTRQTPSAARTNERLGLTQREREVAALIVEGCSNREIAERLVISERTAEAHVSNLLGKANVRSRAQFAVWALQHKL